jgi:hypothetical protein
MALLRLTEEMKNPLFFGFELASDLMRNNVKLTSARFLRVWFSALVI